MADSIFIAGATARSAAESARRAGWRVTATDLFCDRDLQACATVHRVSDYPHDIVKIASKLSPRPWLYTGGLENWPQSVAAISRCHSLRGNPPPVLCGVRDPWILQRVLRSAGLASPGLCDEPPTDVDADARWLCKPRSSSGGMGIRIWSPRAENRLPGTPSAVNVAPHESFYFQRYVRGTSYGAVYLAAGNTAKLMGVARQLVGCRWAGASRFHFVGAIGPVVLAPHWMDQYQRIGQQLASLFDLHGLFGVDTIISQQRVWTIEVNPRFTASVELHERATGWCAFNDHMRACEEGRLPTESLPEPCGLHAKAIIYAPRDGEVDDAFCGWIDAQNRQTRHARLADLPASGLRITMGAPLLTVFAQGDCMTDTYRRLRVRAQTVKRQFTRAV